VISGAAFVGLDEAGGPLIDAASEHIGGSPITFGRKRTIVGSRGVYLFSNVSVHPLSILDALADNGGVLAVSCR
jgi:hypothetical protein